MYSWAVGSACTHRAERERTGLGRGAGEQGGSGRVICVAVCSDWDARQQRGLQPAPARRTHPAMWRAWKAWMAAASSRRSPSRNSKRCVRSRWHAPTSACRRTKQRNSRPGCRSYQRRSARQCCTAGAAAALPVSCCSCSRCRCTPSASTATAASAVAAEAASTCASSSSSSACCRAWQMSCATRSLLRSSSSTSSALVQHRELAGLTQVASCGVAGERVHE